MTAQRLFLVLVVAVFSVGLGCFPEEADSPLMLSIPLKEIGVTLGNGDVRSYMNWLGKQQQGLTTTFDLGLPGNTFYLGIGLQSENKTGDEPRMEGREVSFDEKEQTFLASLSLDSCTQCAFVVAIFLKETSGMSTFTGTSATFDFPGAGPTTRLDLSAAEHPTGRIVCRPVNGLEAGAVRFASVDLVDNVRFPAIDPSSSAETMEVALPDIPVGRPTLVQYQDEATGGYADLSFFDNGINVPSVTLTSGGQTRLLECRHGS